MFDQLTNQEEDPIEEISRNLVAVIERLKAIEEKLPNAQPSNHTKLPAPPIPASADQVNQLTTLVNNLISSTNQLKQSVDSKSVAQAQGNLSIEGITKAGENHIQQLVKTGEEITKKIHVATDRVPKHIYTHTEFYGFSSLKSCLYHMGTLLVFVIGLSFLAGLLYQESNSWEKRYTAREAFVVWTIKNYPDVYRVYNRQLEKKSSQPQQ